MSDVPAAALVALAVAAGVLAVLLSAGETAILRLNRAAVSELAFSSGPGARTLRRLVEGPHVAASAAAWVRVLCEAVTAVSLTLAIASSGLVWWQTFLVTVVLVAALSVVVVRYAPRTVARRHPLAAALLTAPLMAAARAVAAPSRLLSRASADAHHLSDDELRDMVDRVSESEHIEEDEREMFRSVLELGDTITRAVMVPRTEMITLSAGTPVRKALSLFLRSGYSRVPVVGESVDDVLGLVYLKDLVRRRFADPDVDDAPVDDMLRPAVFVPESKPVDDLLREMQEGAFHMALVVDEFGGVAGLVTIEDALEEIVGELTDEHDRAAPEVEDLGDGTFRVPARTPLDELGDLFDLELEDDDVDTAGGLLAKALGKVPLEGSSAQVAGLVLTADRAEGRRKQVSTLLAARIPARAPAGAPAEREGSDRTERRDSRAERRADRHAERRAESSDEQGATR